MLFFLDQDCPNLEAGFMRSRRVGGMNPLERRRERGRREGRSPSVFVPCSVEGTTHQPAHRHISTTTTTTLHVRTIILQLRPGHDGHDGQGSSADSPRRPSRGQGEKETTWSSASPGVMPPGEGAAGDLFVHLHKQANIPLSSAHWLP